MSAMQRRIQNSQTESAKVWWPSDAVVAESGYLVGWNTRGFSCLVAAIVTEQRLVDIERGLDEVAQDGSLAEVRQDCRGELMVLGEWSHGRKGGPLPDSTEAESAARRARRRSADLWLRMSRSRSEGVPLLRDVYCCGVTYRPSYNVVMFSCPAPGHPVMTELSLPRILPRKPVARRRQRSRIKSGSGKAGSSKRSSGGKRSGGGGGGRGGAGGGAGAAADEEERSDRGEEIEVKVRQVNACMAMRARLFRALGSGSAGGGSAGGGGGIGSPGAAGGEGAMGLEEPGAAGAPGGTWTQDEQASALRSLGYTALLGMRYTAEVLLPLLEAPLPLPISSARQAALARRWRSDGGERIRLVDVSAMANQVNFKMQQFCLLPFGSALLFAAHGPNPSARGAPTVRLVDITDTTLRHTYGLGMLNSLYVGVLDMLLGVCFILLLFYGEEHLMAALATPFEASRRVYIDFLREYVDWLIDEPAGFKLNKNLNRFLGAVYVDSIDVWDHAYTCLAPGARLVLQLLSLCGVGGMSCLLALMADVLSLSTLHICLFYRSMGAAYAHMLRVLHSLALLFQGQKWNTLRSRADTCEFELDQLLLGTLLFAVHFFLFPNIVGFYIFFVVIWAQVVLLQLGLALALLLLNHFPFYACALLVTDPGQVCGGISFKVLSKPSLGTSPRSAGESRPDSTDRTSSSSSMSAGGDPAFAKGEDEAAQGPLSQAAGQGTRGNLRRRPTAASLS